ncbi:MAG: hypothetical protein JWO79_15 [Actinomycetia bacterium]|nr:hypothetical protein [Actinomycetes bacterium]
MAALADFDTLGPEIPGRPRLAALLVTALLRSGRMMDDVNLVDSAAALAEIADADPEPVPDWTLARAALRALWLTRSLQVGRAGVTPASVLAELDGLEAVVAGRRPWVTPVALARTIADQLERQRTNDLSDAGPSTFEDVIDAEPLSPQDIRKQIFTIMFDAQNAIMRGDVGGALAEFDRAAELRRYLPLGDSLLAAFDEALSSMNAIRSMIDPSFASRGPAPQPPRGAPPTVEDPLAELRTRAARADLSASQRAVNLLELASAEQAMAEPLGRPGLLDGSVGHLRDAVALAPDHDPE